MRILSLLLQLTVALAQFIDAPTAFDTAAIYVAPTGTSIFSFGNEQDLPASTAIPLTSNSIVFTAQPDTRTEPQTPVPQKTTSVPFSTDSPLFSDSTSKRGPSDVSLVAETVFETFYTTVPCTTSNSPPSPAGLGQETAILTSQEAASTSSDVCQVAYKTKILTVSTKVTRTIESTVFVTRSSTMTGPIQDQK